MSDRDSTPCQRCGECCGIVACSREEGQTIQAYVARRSLTPLRQGTRCPWFQNAECVIYPVRPWACRMFGRVTELLCPHGHNRRMSHDERHRRTASMRQQDNRHPYFLHGAVYTPPEIAHLIQSKGE